MEFRDYYATLGVDRDASPDTIKKTFRKRARECHPDHVPAKEKAGAEARFKELNEAYEVLSDPEKRRKYDGLGTQWNAQAGARAQEWGAGENFFGGETFRDRDGARAFHFGGTGFSDFFEQFFGTHTEENAAFGRGGQRSPHRFGREPFSARTQTVGRGRDVESEIMVTFEEALRGSVREISLRRRDPATGNDTSDTIRVKLPAGVREGQRIRVAGKGSPGPSGAGDLYLRVRLERHPDFRVEGDDIVCDVDLAPWEAVLGCSPEIPTLEGNVRIRVKPGTQSGNKLRLRGRGLPLSGGRRGDLLASVRIRVPETVSDAEKALWEQLASVSGFTPRQN